MQGENVHRHALTMTDCKILTVSGVTEVISFDEGAVVLVTSCGTMTIEGEGLHIARLDLDKGVTDVSGLISALIYTKMKDRSGGFFRRGK